MNSYLTLSAIQNDLKTGNVTVSGLVSSYLQNIEAGKHLNAFLEVYADEARQRAEEIDQKLAAGNAGKLAGMVIAVKDNIVYRNHRVSASSKILENFESLFTATALERLLAEDAIVIGRTNCDEFAMGSSNENSAYGNVKNHLDNARVPGGSSGGSAVAVGANMCHAALGSDTGGSIRQPASFCGIVGMKPTYGRISRSGLIAYASSFDQIGPLTKSVEDAALLYEVMAGHDPMDNTTSSVDVSNYGGYQNPGKKKIGYFKSFTEHEGLDPEIRNGVNSMLESLKADGHDVVALDFPYLEYLVPTYYVLTTAEASSNLARYDGVHFGYRSKDAKDLESTYVNSRSEGFGIEVKRRIMLGTFVLSSGYYDAYYAKGQKVRRKLKEEIDSTFKLVDHVLIPTCPHTAFEIGHQVDDPIKMYLEDIFTVIANLTGNPAISLPVGTHSNGLPFGIQIMSNSFKENELFNFAQHLMNINPLKS